MVENLARSLNELIQMVRELREEVRRQREEIQQLRSLIENCAGCQKAPTQLRESCQHNNPCFPGMNYTILEEFNLLIVFPAQQVYIDDD